MSSARIDPLKRIVEYRTYTEVHIRGVVLGLESSSTGSSFPADSAKPVPWLPSQCFVLIKRSVPLVRTSSELAVRRLGKIPKRAVPSPSPADTKRSALAMLAAQAAC
ncbi:unnamed protein product [Brassica napus]|uniref:(rape) hypothetical protein n=1 Tax=Brassica napus TaxID=3708 RepID=A0A816P3A8_BRANA|nr:unnamed protein product [Brassica napus]